MSSIKIHLKLLLGDGGTSLTKLKDITDKVQNFLTNVGQDSNLKIDPNKWIAKKFKIAGTIPLGGLPLHDKS